jgi:ArsR family transcriptional regulator
MKNLASLFKALSDETRLTMMNMLLRHGELCVCDFVGAMDITQSKASRHLRYLLNAGLLDDRRDGLWSYYRIKSDSGGRPEEVMKAVAPLLKGPIADVERRLKSWFKTKNQRGSCQRKTG